MASRPDDARAARQAALVLAGTGLLWIGAQILGGRLGWDTRIAILFDLAALAGFTWALVTTWRIWRRRQGK
ncbi:DUF5337 domain-containing protein [Rhodobacter sp. CZR27]|uniref:DUF5337 domain-containing protein n=1 Tax=Rhodobacter sp. CZR27 TaxID=2033869 RepID=UPI000BBF00A2|nr:DUF5337 domain-containing protein [Rhodobacter sp. CZR27]